MSFAFFMQTKDGTMLSLCPSKNLDDPRLTAYLSTDLAQTAHCEENWLVIFRTAKLNYLGSIISMLTMNAEQSLWMFVVSLQSGFK